MFFGGEPLFNENGEKQRCECKVDALGIELHKRTDNRAQNRACDPIDMVKKRDEKAVVLSLFFGHIGGVTTDERVGLVGECEDEVGFYFSDTFIFVEHRNAVEKVSRVYHQRGDSGGDKRRATRQKSDGDILHRPRVDEKAHRKRQKGAKTVRL